MMKDLKMELRAKLLQTLFISEQRDDEMKSLHRFNHFMGSFAKVELRRSYGAFLSALRISVLSSCKDLHMKM